MEYYVFGPKQGDQNKMTQFICEMDQYFTPTLSSRVNLLGYGEKIFHNATKFLYEEKGQIIAMSIAYMNSDNKESFGTFLAIRPEYEADGLGLDLVLRTIGYAKKIGSSSFKVNIRASNNMLYKFYLSQGFKISKEDYYPNSEIIEYELIKHF